ncbi:hypothetical protein Geob_2962 [Geotalea daltonii FRC-32]|uniref:Uncharacterized protein n=1 Tax=Geotalea daltonii (strain DSM 22248 / JCM 15807 / FRC-32) TaxID=316067 RepID=B9M2V9_GEODF|nr:hypothetical protein [Geotalea daltonii]ACM21305.1 hypothetical protein Geob_2962 [Geotalea daltonii FRC-32]
MKKKVTTLFLSVLCLFAVSSANAMIIVADHFNMDKDWSGITDEATKGITSTDASGNKWASLGANYPVVINQESAYGDAGRGLRFQVAPGSGTTTIGCEMGGYPQTPWQGRSQYIGYYSKLSDNSNWGSKGSTLKMLRFNMEKNDVIPELVGGAYSVFIGTSNVFNGIYRPDNNWHKYLWEFTAQSSSAVADGVIRLWVDDVVVWERTNVKWNDYGTINNGTYFNYGYNGSWYFFFIQGNLSATYNGPTKYMYWDDYIIATTKEEVDKFIGTSGTSSTPAAPVEPAPAPAPVEPAPAPAAPVETAGVTLLQEKFNDALLSSRGWFDAGATNSKVVNDATRGNVLEYSYNSGASTPTTGALRKEFTDADDITITYYVKYASNWQWTGLGYGPHELYLLSNLDSSWIGPAKTHLTTYLESIEGKQTIAFQDALNIDQNRVGTSLKGISENRGVFGCNGSSDSYPDGICWGTPKINGKTWKASMPVITNGVWHSVKVRLKMNSIINGVGVADGIMQYWLDGVPYMDNKNIMIRTGANPNLKWSTFMIAPYFHNGAKQTQKFWLDDIQVTTGTSTADTPPAPPTGLRIVL